MRRNRRVKIVATLGPASAAPEMVERLFIAAGISGTLPWAFAVAGLVGLAAVLALLGHRHVAEMQQELSDFRVLSEMLHDLPRQTLPAEFAQQVMQSAERRMLLPERSTPAAVRPLSRRRLPS